jgi:nitrogen fixation protein FixH
MKRSTLWPLGIIGVLGITVGVNLAVYYVANDDPSLAIEKDYYRKAVNWDSTIAQARVNEALGWRLTPSLGAFTPARGAHLRVRLTDSTGTPIVGATVRVSAFFNARANNVVDTTLTAAAGGSDGYEGRLLVNHAGVWELRFEVTRGGSRFTATSRVEAAAAGATGP